MKMQPYKPGDISRVKEAVVILREARALLVLAGATRAADKVRRALKSAEGARRHVQHRQMRARADWPHRTPQPCTS